jgi:hypothetical protein
MRFHQNLGAAGLAVLIVSVAIPVLAGGKHFARTERTEMNGVIVTGPAWARCNGSRATPRQPCIGKAKA